MKSMQERIKKANKTYCDGHDQEGIKVCSWENMPGWQKFLKGEITETQLSAEAQQELAELDQSFGKYLRTDKDKDLTEPAKDDPLGEKVKIANKIYRKACVDSGMSPCFFKNFATWQQFVHGEIEEADFYEKAREEIRKIAVEQQSDN
ncbi:MAG: hypothetical protein ABSG91_19635 [Syntrophobacteraceae bacterium]|jgi:hypothetical protein